MIDWLTFMSRCFSAQEMRSDKENAPAEKMPNGADGTAEQMFQWGRCRGGNVVDSTSGSVHYRVDVIAS
ncbi:hypothetical protein AXG93_4182s1010 [Marchantia polymorpha subsp. ruderalis]|uniref:Uncharacterized protein n=1 Tax=Marchantia polymorpha subsp. ruderalis TaxID=1480154 RepID=A0A176VEZ0_MARPO|nr:hypothetical protein AXG93_4182s1010 [Marchantia polymorpha subsp. ruderalis]